MATKTTVEPQQNAVAVVEPTVSQRFMVGIQRQFQGFIGQPVEFDPLQQRLVQHLFLKIDASLAELEKKRANNPNKKNQPAIAWANVNMEKLSTDAVHRVQLGLDAMIPNHISVIPYLNSRTQKYDVDLRIGYAGKDYYRRKVAVEEPLDIRYSLVFENDTFIPHLKDGKNEVESYEFRCGEDPFNRGKVVGGFGYITFDDPRKNVLVIVTMRDFEKARSASKGDEFWGTSEGDKWRLEMQFKTVVLRTLNKLPMDPAKSNAASAGFIEDAEYEDVPPALVEPKEGRQSFGFTRQPQQIADAQVVPEQGPETVQSRDQSAPLTHEPPAEVLPPMVDDNPDSPDDGVPEADEPQPVADLFPDDTPDFIKEAQRERKARR